MSQQCLFDYVLRLGDNALILGQQLGALVTTGPELEEEMATANFALDYIGQARLFYSYAAEIEGKGRSEDDIAFLRDSNEYRNLLLLEQTNGDFAKTIARQLYFENFYLLQLAALARSSDSRLAGIAEKAEKEIRYHVRHTGQWLARLGDGTDESHCRMQAALEELWRFTGEMMTADDLDRWAAEKKVGPDPETLRPAWNKIVLPAIEAATLKVPGGEWMASGGKQGIHSESLGYLLADLQYLQRSYPGVRW